MGLLSRAARRASSVFASPEAKLALEYDLALSRGANKNVMEGLVAAPRDVEHGMWATERGAISNIVHGTRNGVPVPDALKTKDFSFFHHTHPLDENHLPSPLSPNDLRIAMSRKIGMFAHEVPSASPSGIAGGSYAAAGRRASADSRYGLDPNQLQNMAIAALRQKGMNESEAIMHAPLVLGRAMQRRAYIKNYGYRPSNPDQQKGLLKWRRAIKDTENEIVKLMPQSLLGDLALPLAVSSIGAGGLIASGATGHFSK